MAASINAVAPTCVSAPAATQGQKLAGGCGRPCPSASITAARKMSAKGKPKRNRTWVAPTVPSLAVSSRWVALRTVCAAAAMMVKRAQSHEGSSIGTWPPRAKSGGRAFRDYHVIHIHVARELPAIGEKIVDDAGLVDDGESVPLERRLELVRRDGLVPSVRTARQPAQHVFGADDRQGEALERAVERGGDHDSSRLDHLRAAPDEEAKIRDMLDHFHREHDVEAFALLRKRFGRARAVVHGNAGLGRMLLRRLDIARRGIGAHHRRAKARQRLAQNAAAAADVEYAQARERVEARLLAAELPACCLLDESQPHRVEPV